MQGMKQARGGHWNLGILRGDSAGDIREYWGFATSIQLGLYKNSWAQGWTAMALSRLIKALRRLCVSTLGLFQTLGIYMLLFDNRCDQF